MFLGLNVLGGDSILNNTLPPRQTYNKITFIGGNQVMDGVHLKAEEMTDDSIKNINTEELFFEYNTIFLGNFQNTLEAGNISNSDNPITGWVIRRKRPNDTLNPIIAELPYTRELSTYTDYTPQNRTEYIYSVSPVTSNSDPNSRVEGRGIEGVGTVDFYGWTLTSLDEIPTIFKFDMDIESSNIEVIQQFKKYENNTQFPAFRWGGSMYKEGTLKTIPYEFNQNNNTYEINIVLLENLKNFINNKDIKLLKMPSGEVFNIVTYDFSYKYMDDVISQPYTINFKWTQVG